MKQKKIPDIWKCEQGLWRETWNHRDSVRSYKFSEDWTLRDLFLFLRFFLHRHKLTLTTLPSRGREAGHNGLVLVLARSWCNLWTFQQPVCFSAGMGAAADSRHSFNLNISNFPALQGTLMADYINSFQVLLLTLHTRTTVASISENCLNLFSERDGSHMHL